MENINGIAIFSSITAIIVSLISAIVNVRQQRKSTMIIEKIKFDLEVQRLKRAEKKDNIIEQAKVIDDALTNIQFIKDSLSILSHYITDKKKLNEWLDKICVSIEVYNTQYGNGFMHVSKEEKDQLHKTKGIIMNLHEHVIRLRNDIQNNKAIDFGNIQFVEKVKQDLNLQQQGLLNAKFNIMLNFNTI